MCLGCNQISTLPDLPPSALMMLNARELITVLNLPKPRPLRFPSQLTSFLGE